MVASSRKQRLQRRQTGDEMSFSGLHEYRGDRENTNKPLSERFDVSTGCIPGLTDEGQRRA